MADGFYDSKLSDFCNASHADLPPIHKPFCLPSAQYSRVSHCFYGNPFPRAKLPTRERQWCQPLMMTRHRHNAKWLVQNSQPFESHEYLHQPLNIHRAKIGRDWRDSPGCPQHSNRPNASTDICYLTSTIQLTPSQTPSQTPGRSPGSRASSRTRPTRGHRARGPCPSPPTRPRADLGSWPC